jgi:hypothetical protein
MRRRDWWDKIREAQEQARREIAQPQRQSARRGSLPVAGDLVLLGGVAAHGIRWLVLGRSRLHPCRWLAVPVDGSPLLGARDVRLLPEQAGRAVTLRCAWTMWLPTEALSAGVRTGWLGARALALARRCLRSPPAGGESDEDTPEYQQWLARVRRCRRDLVRRLTESGHRARPSVSPGQDANHPFTAEVLMSQSTRFDQVHIYLDESGKLHLPEEGERLVGGVTLRGNPAEVEADLLTLLRESVFHAGGSFPADLHHRGGSLPMLLGEEVRRRLQARPDISRRLHGVVIRHEQDLDPEGGLLTGEAQADNRYQRMLEMLLQHLFHVAGDWRAGLRPEGVVHLHLASRPLVFPTDPARRAQLEALGYEVRTHRAPGHEYVQIMLRANQLAPLLQGALQRLWGSSPLRLNVEPVYPINYDPGRPPSQAGLYLADLYLSSVRSRLVRGFDRVPGLLPAETRLTYNAALDRQLRRQALLARGEAAGYLTLCRDINMGLHTSCDAAQVQEAEEASAAQLLDEQSQTPRSLAEHAAEVVELPGRCAEGQALAEKALRLNQRLRQPDPRTRLWALQALIAAANHSGASEQAEQLWDEYLRLESGLGTSEELLRHAREIRNRRVVALTDRFRYGEAQTLMEQLTRAQERLWAQQSEVLGRSVPAGPNPELATLYGTLGQVYAFLGTAELQQRTEQSFRRSVALQADETGRLRQWVYLGHLACDRGEAGRSLWAEACRAFPALGGTGPITGEQMQFALALQAKGLLCFGTAEAQEAFLTARGEQDPLSAYPSEERAQHPFGLIHQTMGELYAASWRRTRRRDRAETSLEAFRVAAEQMTAQDGILAVLGHIAWLRRGLFLLEAFPEARTTTEGLARRLTTLREVMLKHAGPEGWRSLGGENDATVPVEEQARRIVAAVRFNFW